LASVYAECVTLQLPDTLQRQILAGGNWLFIWRDHAELSLDEIEARSDIDANRLAAIESDEVYPDQEEIEAIAKALGTTADAIIAVQD
jgi:transcriptional regulator with XRE-family HTH domain